MGPARPAMSPRSTTALADSMERRWSLGSADEDAASTPTTPPARLVAARDKLTAEVYRRLRMACGIDDAKDRDMILTHLITDLAGEMDDTATRALSASPAPSSNGRNGDANHLHDEHQMRLRRESEQRASPAAPASRFYEAVASQVVREDAASRRALFSLFVQLLVHPKASLAFAAVMHRYVLLDAHRVLGAGSAPDDDLDESECSAKRDHYTHVCLKGCRHLFWSDVHSNATRFRALYAFLSDEVVLSDRGLGYLSPKAQTDCARMVARFSLYYTTPSSVAQIVSAFPASKVKASLSWSGRLIFSHAATNALVLDYFVREIMHVMKRTKVSHKPAHHCETLSALPLLLLSRSHPRPNLLYQ